MRIHTLLSALSFLLLSACLPSPLFIIEPPPCPEDDCGGPRVMLELFGPAGTDLTAGADLHVTLFGYDATVADVGASVIETWDVDVSMLPAVIDLDFPTDFAERIEHNNGDPDQHEYYVHVWIDADGDGELCGTDLTEVGEPAPRSRRAGTGTSQVASSIHRRV